MRDDTVDQFTAHELTRGDLQALMTRSDGPGLVRAAWHLGALAVTGTLLWIHSGRSTAQFLNWATARSSVCPRYFS